MISKNGTPFCEKFQDYYFSKHDPVGESKYVFIDGNRLPDRILVEKTIHIAETGFGLGRNFFTLVSWLKKNPNGASIHFHSVDKYPPDPEQIRQALKQINLLHEEAEEFLSKYDPQNHKQISLSLHKIKLTLNLHFADVMTLPSIVEAPFNAIFLDGFTPSLNAEMWKDELFDKLVESSADNVTFATYSASSEVRKSLSRAGFLVEKRPGFYKREMLCGYLKKFN